MMPLSTTRVSPTVNLAIPVPAGISRGNVLLATTQIIGATRLSTTAASLTVNLVMPAPQVIIKANVLPVTPRTTGTPSSITPG